MRKGFLYLLTFVITLLSFASCTATKYVPDGSYLLDEVKIHTDQKNVRPSSLRMYVRQNPNAKWFSLIKTQLYVYNLSGRDSTKWGNKFLRRIGDAPVIYSETEAQRSQDEITKAMRNMGYMAATVKRSTKIKKKKIKLYYEVTARDPYIVSSLKYDIHDPKIAEFLKQDSAKSLLKEGMIFDVNVLDAERQRITDKLLRNGYYKFNKDYVGYTADTVRGTYQVDLTLHLHAYRAHVNDSVKAHQQYWIDKINFITDYDVLQSSALNSMDINDSLHFKGYPIYYKDKLYLRPKMLTDNLRFASGDLFNEQDVQQTYSNFGRLSALKYTNIRFIENQVGDTAKLDCYVMLTKSKHKSVAFELEGTNSAGDLGAAASVSFQNRNLFRGSETFMIKFRGAYEVISGLQAGYSNNNYTEYGVETSINFPNFLFPFLSSDYKRKIRATTEFGLQYNYQMRPEFLRTMASASWSYKWTQRQKIQHRIDLINIGFLYLPRISEKFKEDFINKGQSHILQYNYQDRLIINMGYSYHYNSIGGAIVNNTIASNSYSIRFNFESAGNIMYALSKATNIRKNNESVCGNKSCDNCGKHIVITKIVALKLINCNGIVFVDYGDNVHSEKLVNCVDNILPFLLCFNSVAGKQKLSNRVVVLAEKFVIHKHKLTLTDCGKSLFFLGFGRSLVKTCLAHSYSNSTRRNEDNLFSAVLQIGKYLAKLFNSSVIYFSVFISQR